MAFLSIMSWVESPLPPGKFLDLCVLYIYSSYLLFLVQIFLFYLYDMNTNLYILYFSI